MGTQGTVLCVLTKHPNGTGDGSLSHSVGIYYFTDIKENASGNTLREEIKIWAKNLW